MKKLYEDMRWPTEKAMAELDGHIRAYCARKEREKARRREALGFYLALGLAALAAALAFFQGVTIEQLLHSRAAWALLGVMALILLLSPVLAYFVEEERYEHEEE